MTKWRIKEFKGKNGRSSFYPQFKEGFFPWWRHAQGGNPEYDEDICYNNIEECLAYIGHHQGRETKKIVIHEIK